MKRIYILLTITICSMTIWGQDILRDQHYSTGNSYKAITLADYNNDGIVDVWSGNNNNNHVEIWSYSHTGDTLVKIDSIYSGFPSPNAHIHDIAVGDLDKDGDMDAVVTFRFNGTYLCMNNGVGNWSVTHLDSSYGWQIIIRDFNNDNNPDILLSTDYSYLKIFYGDGTGSFTSGVAPSDGGSAVSHGINAVDLDGDNYLDIIGITQRYSDNMDFLRVYINHLDDTSSWSSSIAPNDTLNQPDYVQSSKFSAGDLNNDGFIDQIYFSPFNGNIIALMGGETGGNLTWTPNTILSNYPHTFKVVSTFDIDGDNDLDIIVGGREQFDGVIILENDGLGNFTLQEIPLGFGVGNYHDIAFGDIDGNGMNDIIGAQYNITNSSDDGFHVFFFKRNNSIIYVNQSATGNNNGTSWTDAYTDFQSALSNAQEKDTIWVAAGIYKPSTDKTGDPNPTDNREKTFQLIKKVPIYGGFSGTETSLEQRDWKTNQTILSGDLGIAGDNSDNAYQVVKGADSLSVDGFIIKYGNANGPNTNHLDLGGGMYNENLSNITIRNCIFRDNTGLQGGALANFFCNASIKVINSTFFNNSSDAGGAIGNWNTNAQIKGCAFYYNTADNNINGNGFGGAIYNWGAISTSEMINCTFYGNVGTIGSAIHNRGVTSTCKNSIIWGNTGSDAIGNTHSGDCIITYSDIDQTPYDSGMGCINNDPLLHQINDIEYQLESNSPCIDAGDPDPIYNDTDGTRNDMGAHHTIYDTNVINSILDNSISVYPNPTADYLFVMNKKNENLLYQIFDINGKLLQTIKATRQETKIKINQFACGNYFIKVIKNNQVIKIFKIIKTY